ALFIAAFVLVAAYLYHSRKTPLFVRNADHPASASMACAEWAVLIVLALILGPQTTSRHMVMLLPAYAVAAALLLAPGRRVNRWPLLAATVLLALSLVLPPGGAALEWWRGIAGASWCG